MWNLGLLFAGFVYFDTINLACQAFQPKHTASATAAISEEFFARQVFWFRDLIKTRTHSNSRSRVFMYSTLTQVKYYSWVLFTVKCCSGTPIFTCNVFCTLCQNSKACWNSVLPCFCSFDCSLCAASCGWVPIITHWVIPRSWWKPHLIGISIFCEQIFVIYLEYICHIFVSYIFGIPNSWPGERLIIGNFHL